ncbi:glycogen/starch/alpha-glucan phosphorylase [Cyanobacteria bacterium FACHB-63]|nr:glycogen/starch/alpha-glucan phosphorylase [Cyanobacteria bacterium FACHB-63]
MQAEDIQLPTTDELLRDDRTGLDVETLKRSILNNLFYVQGKFPEIAALNDYYMALAYTVRDRLLRSWLITTQTYTKVQPRQVCYLSAEFLLGPHLGNNLINLDIYDQMRQATQELGLNFDELLAQEEEPGLGNGGLGRLAACYLDSMATLEIPAIGYGIRYEFGIFDQDIHDGWQVEITDKWLKNGNPWELARPEWAVEIQLGGRTERYTDEQGRNRVRWIPDRVLKGVPYDTPILGYKTDTANTLRLWSAQAVESFDFAAFNSGNYYGAVGSKVVSENVSKVLYPNDEQTQGKQLRLEQQFFFVSCSLQDAIRTHCEHRGMPIATLHEYFTFQLNDTHPAIAVAELMRLLMDVHGVDWDAAWHVTCNTFAYTNHTLLPEALERWSIGLFGSLLPRHLEIIYDINARFLDEVRQQFPNDSDRIRRMSLIDESGDRAVRMANLATVGSYSINGVAELHTQLLKQDVLRDFAEMYPERFNNKTNGVTPRRFMVLSNPRLAHLITSKIGENWIKNLEELRKLESFVDDPQFCDEWRQIKQAIKQDLANYIQRENGIEVDVNSIFDIQSKRFHEYKRQHLNVLHIITLYNRIKANPDLEVTPRTFIFAGKAAPGYKMAKLIIKLINSIADVINPDPDVRGRIKVIFLKDYNVKFAQRVYPAADLSEQISTAGKEASGTGNMKFSMNGALTIGTLDGANIEIREEVGAENFFLFGLTASEVAALKAEGYQPMKYYNENPELKQAIDQIASGFFSKGDSTLFKPLIDSLWSPDPFMLLADYQAYVEAQERVGEAYRDQEHWVRMSILNTARMGKFSSDRSIREYTQTIWNVPPLKVCPPGEPCSIHCPESLM